MVERLAPILIDIPDASIHQQAGKIVVDAIREGGLDPLKVIDNRMIHMALGAWGRGEYSKADFLHVCGLVLALNPSFALGVHP